MSRRVYWYKFKKNAIFLNEFELRSFDTKKYRPFNFISSNLEYLFPRLSKNNKLSVTSAKYFCLNAIRSFSDSIRIALVFPSDFSFCGS